MGRLNKKRSARARNKTKFLIFLILAGLLVILSVFAPLLTPNDPNATSATHMNEAPSRAFPFGTDRYGRCICSRVLMGARTSIFSAVTLVAATFVFGSVLGMLAGWYGGVADTLVMRLADVLLAFPQMVLAIAVAGILGGGMFNAMLAMGITGWTLYARLARAQVLALKEEAYVSAARLTGFRGRWEILCRNPLTICDIAHNPPALEVNFRRLKSLSVPAEGPARPLLIVYGAMADKDVRSIVELMPPEAEYFLVAPKGERAMPVKDLALKLKNLNFTESGTVAAGVDDALRRARVLAGSGSDPIVYIGGSTFVVSEAVSYLESV